MYRDGLRFICTDLTLVPEFSMERASFEEFFNIAKFGPKTKVTIGDFHRAYTGMETYVLQMFPITEERYGDIVE